MGKDTQPSSTKIEGDRRQDTRHTHIPYAPVVHRVLFFKGVRDKRVRNISIEGLCPAPSMPTDTTAHSNTVLISYLYAQPVAASLQLPEHWRERRMRRSREKATLTSSTPSRALSRTGRTLSSAELSCSRPARPPPARCWVAARTDLGL